MARPSLGGMLATRQGALLLAVLCAVCAAGILMFALGQYRTGLQTPTVQATALVATAEIGKGTSGDAVAARSLYKSTPIVAAQLQPGAISDASMLAGKIASTDILPGQQLTLADFAGVSGVTGLLTPSQRAVAITIAESPGATDVLEPGDRVDVYAMFASGSMVLMGQNIQVIKQSGGTVTTPNGQASSAPAGGTTTAAASSTTSTSSGAAPAAPAAATATGSSMVLAVSDKQASDFVYAAQKAQLYLTLRPANASGRARIFTSPTDIARDAIAYSNPTLNGGH
jgi:Flp pilus assembly protein CpaB